MARNTVAATERILLSCDEVSALIGVGRTRIYEMIKAGEFPRPRRVGTLSRWHRGDLDTWAASLPTDAGAASAD